MFADGALRREHHRIGAVHHRVGDVRDFGARGHRARDHGLHHLRGRDHDLIARARFVDDGFLQAGDRRVAHLHAEVAARDHDHVGRVDDLGEVVDGLVTLDLGAQVRMTAGRAHQLAREVHVRGVTRERDGDVIDTPAAGELDVFAILVGERRRGDAAAFEIHALAVRQLAARDHFGVDARAGNLGDFELDESVVQQQDVAGLHVLRQVLVGAADDLLVARVDVVRGVEREGLAVLEIDLLVGEALDADLRAAEVGENADVTPGAPRGLVHEVDAATVFFVFAV